MVDEYCNETKFTLPAYGGKVRKKIVILLNQTVTKGTRQLFGLDQQTGKIVNIVGKKSLPAGLVRESTRWKGLTPKTVIEGEFRKISGFYINTLQLVGSIKKIGIVDLDALRKEFKESGRDFVSDFSDIYDFLKLYPKANGHALMYFDDAWAVRRNNRYLLVTPNGTIQMHHKYVHDPKRNMYCGFVLVRFYYANGKVSLSVERLWNHMLSYNPRYAVNPDCQQNIKLPQNRNKKKVISVKVNKNDLVKCNRDKCISAAETEYIGSNSMLELNYLRSRHVTHLVHFTHIDNLSSILKDGLLPHNQIPQSAICNDEQRLDGHTDCSCLSISFPNYMMLYQQGKKHLRSNYIVLGFSPDFLATASEKNVAYFPANAATKSYRDKFENHTGIKNLKIMFENPKPDIEYVRPATLPDYFTTNPQAEMLFRGSISPNYINRIYVRDETTQTQVKNILDQCGAIIPTEINKEIFLRREDYKLWMRQDGGEEYYGK